MFLLTIQTGLRISELVGLNCADVVLGAGAHVPCVGKGRKERNTPLDRLTVDVIRAWLTKRGGIPTQPLFPTITGRRLTRDAVEHRVTRYATTAAEHCPSLTMKHVTAHTLWHTAAMRLLLAGVDLSVISLWLGHEQTTTTEIYVHADMSQKERAIARVTPPNTKPGRYLAPDQILAFLEAL
jgi:integrase/recombinase XerD